MRRLLAGVLSCALWTLSFQVVAAASGCGGGFTDLPDSHVACVAVSDLTSLGVLSGYPDGSFQPERPVTRAELAALLIRLLGIEPVPGVPSGFDDVAPTHWAARTGAVQAAAGAGLILGYSENGTKLFLPDRPVTRSEAVQMVMATAKNRVPADAQATPYADIQPGVWYEGAVGEAYSAGLIGPAAVPNPLWIGNFEGSAAATRAEVALLLHNLATNTVKQDGRMFLQKPLQVSIMGTDCDALVLIHDPNTRATFAAPLESECSEVWVAQVVQQPGPFGIAIPTLSFTKTKVPSPGGRLGGPLHRDTVARLVEWLESQGIRTATEVAVRNAAGRVIRYIDVVAQTAGGTIGFQVGRLNQNLTPVAREARAIQDILANLQNPRNFDLVKSLQDLRFVPYQWR